MSDKKEFKNYRSANRIGLEELGGNVYSYGPLEQREKYLRTTKAIGEYAGTEISEEMWALVNKREETTFEEPDEPGRNATRAELKKYEMKLRVSHRR